MIPVLPTLILDFVRGDVEEGAHIIGVFATVWALMHFVFSPIQGVLSDRFGRRPLILLSNVGLSLDYVLMASAPNVGWLLVGRVLSGITAASIGTANAYIADVTPPEERARAFGMLGAAFGLGFVVGPALGGVFGAVDPRLPFWISAALSMANATYGYFILPESLPPERRAAFDWRKANPVAALRMLGSRAELWSLACVSFLGNLAHAVLPSVFVLYAGYRYQWAEREVGLTLAAVGVCASVVQATLVGKIVRRFGEKRTLLFGLAMGVLGFLIYGAAPTGWWFLAGVPVMSLWGLSGAAVQGLLTRRVSASEQGQLQGANSSLMGIAELVGPLVFTSTFAYAVRGDSVHLPGAPFFLAALLLSVGFAAGALIKVRDA